MWYQVCIWQAKLHNSYNLQIIKTIELSVVTESNICMFLFTNVLLGLSKASFMQIHGFHKG
jgi:hypothetical protein